MAEPARIREKAEAQSGPDPEIRQDGDDLTFNWINDGITIDLRHLRDGSDGVHGEIQVSSRILGVLHWGRINLASISARDQIYRKLRGTCPVSTEWYPILDETCRLATERIRAGAPFTALTGVKRTGLNHFFIDPAMPMEETSIIFGDGGSGKSLLALSLAISASSLLPLPGFSPQKKVSVMILDYEATEEEVDERLALLCAALKPIDPLPIFYRPMVRRIADDVSFLRSEISKLNVGLIIVDSLAPAFGNPNDPDLVINAMNALRSLSPATRLVISHISKAEAAEKTGSNTPYGSVYVKNLARSVWELKRADQMDEDDDLIMGLYHRKVNAGKLHHPIGLRFAFSKNEIAIHSESIADQPQLLAKANLSYRVLKAMAEGIKTTKELSEELEAKDGTVKNTLNRLRKKGMVIRLDDHRGGKPGQWGLTVSNGTVQPYQAGTVLQ